MNLILRQKTNRNLVLIKLKTLPYESEAGFFYIYFMGKILSGILAFTCFLSSAQESTKDISAVDSALVNGGLFVFMDYPSMCMPKVSPETRYILLDVLNYLEKDSLASIKIKVHTDYRDTEENNMNLSLNRAAVMRNFLVQKGLDSLRVQCVGAGESEPRLITNRLQNTYYKFEVGRRLTEEYIKTFDPEWQEIANGLNRRTEIILTGSGK